MAKLRMGSALHGSLRRAVRTAVGVIGSERNRTPIALKTAAPIVGAVAILAGSAMP
jgi:hypothetical protein